LPRSARRSNRRAPPSPPAWPPGSRAAGGIAFAHLGLLGDPDLVAAAEAGIAAGHSAGFAWRTAIEANASALRATGNDLLIERIDDLRDVEHQLLAELSGEGLTASPVPDGAILLADTLLPSQLMALDLGRIGGLATARGRSHFSRCHTRRLFRGADAGRSRRGPARCGGWGIGHPRRHWRVDRHRA
jgi:phosphocarrier protein FPr/phosphocarrier protein